MSEFSVQDVKTYVPSCRYCEGDLNIPPNAPTVVMVEFEGKYKPNTSYVRQEDYDELLKAYWSVHSGYMQLLEEKQS